MVDQACDNHEKQWTAHFEWLNYMIGEVCLNKAVKSLLLLSSPHTQPWLRGHVRDSGYGLIPGGVEKADSPPRGRKEEHTAKEPFWLDRDAGPLKRPASWALSSSFAALPLCTAPGWLDARLWLQLSPTGCWFFEWFRVRCCSKQEKTQIWLV